MINGGGPPDGNGWAWVKFIVQHVLLPIIMLGVGYLFVTTSTMAAEVVRKKDSLEANREHSELREAALRNSLLRNQPPDWFKEWAAGLDARLQRLEERR